jgi:hypothetical protein
LRWIETGEQTTKIDFAFLWHGPMVAARGPALKHPLADQAAYLTDSVSLLQWK